MSLFREKLFYWNLDNISEGAIPRSESTQFRKSWELLLGSIKPQSIWTSTEPHIEMQHFNSWTEMPAGFKSNVKTKKGQDNLLNLAHCILKTIAHLELFGYNWNLLERGWEELLTRYSKDGAVAVLLFMRVPQTFCLVLCTSLGSHFVTRRMLLVLSKGLVAQSISGKHTPLCSLQMVTGQWEKQSNFFFCLFIVKCFTTIYLCTVWIPRSGEMELGPLHWELRVSPLDHQEVSTLLVE